MDIEICKYITTLWMEHCNPSVLHHKVECGPYVLTLGNRMATVLRVVYGKASGSSRTDIKKTCVLIRLDICSNHIYTPLWVQ